MTMKCYLAAKVHGIRVTAKNVAYRGSVAVDQTVLDIAGIDPYEQVHVVNMTNGERWITYAIPADPGVFSLNGGGARLGEIGDACVLMTYELTDEYAPAMVLHLDERNAIKESYQYDGHVYAHP